MTDTSVTRFNASLLRTTALAAMAIVAMPSVAFAQSADEQASGDANDGQIVVTAQRRSERLVDVPVTVTAVDGAKLQSAGVNATQQLSQVVPAFRVDYGGGFAQPSVRGVSTAVANVGGGSVVATYVDGFYNASPLSTDFEFLNVSNIQVLKGPQGTLFGRNATAGAVLVTTSEPQEELSMKAKVSYSTFNTVEAGTYVTGGTNGLSFDLGLQYKQTDGWYTNIANATFDPSSFDSNGIFQGGSNYTGGDNKYAEAEAYTIRAGVKLDLGGDNSLLFRYTHTKRDAPEVLMLGVYKDDLGRYETVGTLIPGAVWGTTNRTVAADNGFHPTFTAKVDSYQLTGKFDLGFANLTSYSQYRKEFSHSALEIDDTQIPAFSVSFSNKDVLKTQELLLSSKPGGRLQWVAGMFYMEQEAGQTDFTVDVPALGFAYTTYINPKSFSVFADATYQATDQLYLTLGGRYSRETQVGRWTLGPAGPLIGTPTPPADDPRATFKNFTPRAVIRYEISPQSSVYASFAKGFKSGLLDINGFRASNADPSTIIKPENLTAFELGYKLALPSTRFEVSGFYYDYKNLQVSSYNGTVSLTTNAATSEVYGGEISVYQKLGDLTLSGAVAYTHGRYKRYLTAPGNAYDFTTGGLDNSPTDVSGNHMIRSPDWSGNVAANYVFDVMDGKLEFNANYSFQSTFYFDPANRNKQKAFGLLNLRAGWTDPSDHFTISVFGNNVTDESYYNQVLPNGLATGTTYGSPATYGVSFNIKY